MTDSQNKPCGPISSAQWCCEFHAYEDEQDRQGKCRLTVDERRGRVAAEERLARIRNAISGETWSQAVSRWRFATFGRGPLGRSYERALEEFDELQNEVGLSAERGQLELKPDYDPQKIAKEAADFCIALAAFIGDLGFDLATEISEKHRINSTERQWISKGDGTGYHVKSVPVPASYGYMPRYPALKRVLGNSSWQARAMKLDFEWSQQRNARVAAESRLTDVTALLAHRDASIDALSKKFLGLSLEFSQNPNVCEVYLEASREVFALGKLSAAPARAAERPNDEFPGTDDPFDKDY